MWWKSRAEGDKLHADDRPSLLTLEKKRTMGAKTLSLVRLGVGRTVGGGVGRTVLVLEHLFGRHNEERSDELESSPSALLICALPIGIYMSACMTYPLIKFLLGPPRRSRPWESSTPRFSLADARHLLSHERLGSHGATSADLLDGPLVVLRNPKVALHLH